MLQDGVRVFYEPSALVKKLTFEGMTGMQWD